MTQPGLAFDDVLIEPAYSDLESRRDPDTTSPIFGGVTVPLISANMDTVTGAEMAAAMESAGAVGVLHRFMSKADLYTDVKEIRRYGNMAAVSVGLAKDLEEQRKHVANLVANGATSIVIDVAHGHTLAMIENVEFISSHFPQMYVVAGNVATRDGAWDLYKAGADAIKVGIGPGAACSTRGVTGVGVPQVTAIMNVADQLKYEDDVDIIADGGITNTGDFCKAIAAGADGVMAGSIFAGCVESPGQMFEEADMGQYKAYNGSASNEGRRGHDDANIPEGVSGKVSYTGRTAYDVIQEYYSALQVSMSYVGAKTIREFHRRATLQQITNAGIIESATRI